MTFLFGGEGGIRTHGTQKVQRFSRPPQSTTLSPLHEYYSTNQHIFDDFLSFI